MSRQAGWLAQCGLYGDCYALCLPPYLFGFRSQVNTSVGRRCSLFVDVCRSRLCVWGLAIGRLSIGAMASPYFGTGDIPDSWLFVLLVPREPPLIVSFVISFVL